MFAHLSRAGCGHSDAGGAAGRSGRAAAGRRGAAAARVLGACVQILSAQGSAFEHFEQRILDAATVRLQQALGSAAYAELFAAGGELGWELAIDQTLDQLVALT